MLKLVIIFISFFLVTVFSDAQETVTKWDMVQNKDGIQVYSRNNSLSNIKEVKVVSKINTSLSALVYLIKDADNQPNWAYKLSYVEQIKNYNDKHWCTYAVADVPWPLEDRDNVTDVNLVQNKDSSIVISSKSVDNMVVEKDDKVRIPFIKASWTFKPINNGKIEVSFQLLTDLGGYVPDWIVNLFIEKGPYETLWYYRIEAEKDRYKNIHLNYIVE